MSKSPTFPTYEKELQELLTCCPAIPLAEDRTRDEIENSISEYRDEIGAIGRPESRRRFEESLYASGPLVPCLFNSGCVIGKRAMTCLEISSEKIALVHWFDSQVSRKYLNYHGQAAERLSGTGIYRSVLNSDRLDYVFARKKLLR